MAKWHRFSYAEIDTNNLPKHANGCKEGKYYHHLNFADMSPRDCAVQTCFVSGVVLSGLAQD